MEKTIISQDEAFGRGLQRYFTGKPCRRGHVAERYVSTGNCISCHNRRKVRSSAKDVEDSFKLAGFIVAQFIVHPDDLQLAKTILTDLRNARFAGMSLSDPSEQVECPACLTVYSATRDHCPVCP